MWCNVFLCIAGYPGKYATHFLYPQTATNDNVKGLILCGRFVHMYDGNNNDHGTPRATTACRLQSMLHFDLILLVSLK